MQMLLGCPEGCLEEAEVQAIYMVDRRKLRALRSLGRASRAESTSSVGRLPGGTAGFRCQMSFTVD